MKSECFNLVEDGGVVHIEMCRPEKVNSMNGAFWKELPGIVDDLSARGDVGCVIVSGQGDHFSAGMDLEFFADERFLVLDSGYKREVVYRKVKHMQDAFDSFDRANFPVLAAINGACIGGALDMVAACDLRFVTSDARMVIEEINIGMMADLGVLQRLPILLPDGVVREMAYTGNDLDLERAERLGFVNRIFDSKEAMMAEVWSIAKGIAAKSLLAIQGSKKALNYGRNHGLKESLDYVATLQSAQIEPSDVAMAITARATKEDAEYSKLYPRDEII